MLVRALTGAVVDIFSSFAVALMSGRETYDQLTLTRPSELMRTVTFPFVKHLRLPQVITSRYEPDVLLELTSRHSPPHLKLG